MADRKQRPSRITATPRQKAWIARLRPELQRYFPDDVRHLDLRVAEPPDLRANVRMFSFTVLADGLPTADILVKATHGRQATDLDMAFRAAQVLEQRFATEPHLNTPRMLDLWKEPRALIMEKVEGESLSVRMKDCRNWAIETGCQLAQHFVEQAGRWLALLHEMPAPAWSQPMPDPLTGMESLLTRLRTFGVDPLEEKRIRELIGVLGGNSRHEELPLHGDYGIHNILCRSPHDITVLNAMLAWQGPAARDIGEFMATVRCIDKWHLFGGEMAYTSAVIRQTEQKFLAGYKSVRPVPQKAHIRAYAGLRLLEYWLDHVQHQQTRNIAGLRSLIIRRINQHFVHAILND